MLNRDKQFIVDYMYDLVKDLPFIDIEAKEKIINVCICSKTGNVKFKYRE
jgi:hypothetical protein